MDISQSLKVAFGSLMSNKLRSSLTMLGMVIGVGAVITLMSIGQGAQAAVQAQFARLGTNLVYIDPGTTSSGGVKQQAGNVQTLTYDDVKAIDQESVPDASLVAPEGSTPGQIIYQSQNTIARIKGVTPEYSELHNYNVTQGDWFSDDQMQGSAGVVVLGPTIAQTLFGQVSPIGLRLRLNTGGQRTGTFQVIGVSEAKGGSGFDNPDNTVYVPLTSFFRTLFHVRNAAGVVTVTHVAVKASDEQHINAVGDELTQLLTVRHHIADPTLQDFSITSQQDQLRTRQNVTGVLTIFLGAVAGISLVVGGIGIMNIMIVSVTERTREIGIRKAVGARRNDILMQFLVEAMLVSLLGGAGGIGAGMGIARLVDGRQLNGQAMQTLVTLQSILLAGGVSACIGLFFGIYPASRAARLNPIQALRYE